MTTREFKSEERKSYSANIVIQESVTYGPPQNGYGDVKDTARPSNRNRQVLDVTITADTLEKLQAKIVAHVELAE